MATILERKKDFITIYELLNRNVEAVHIPRLYIQSHLRDIIIKSNIQRNSLFLTQLHNIHKAMYFITLPKYLQFPI